MVTPVYRLPITDTEALAIRHLEQHLAGFDRWLMVPDSLPIEWSGYGVQRFNDECFTGLASYSQLLLSREFYQRFKRYDFILIYQLDCLVFSNDLLSWCDRGYDYIGAPLFPDYRNDPSAGFAFVGNGGLSLRRVSAFLKVLKSRVHVSPPEVLGELLSYRPSSRFIQRLAVNFKTRLHRSGYKNRIRHYLSMYNQNEDLFWSCEATRFCPSFKIPSPEVAVSFSFEMAPQYCFVCNAACLPFGCHAWEKYDRSFWEPYLL